MEAKEDGRAEGDQRNHTEIDGMNREHIIKLAIDCEMEDIHLDGGIFYAIPENLERFATAIRAATKEEDAKICEEKAMERPSYKEYEDTYLDGWIDANNECGWEILASK